MQSWHKVTAADVNFDVRTKHEPASVVCYIFSKAELLWVHHRDRGWEVPGGKLEPGETPLGALRREVLEEAGATITNERWVAEYRIQVDEGDSRLLGQTYKWVYFATLESLGQRLATEEILSVKLEPARAPEEVQRNTDVSPIMKDAVYECLWPKVQGFVQNMPLP